MPHSNAANPRIKSAYKRCCRTSGAYMLAQKGRGPKGQQSGSARSTMKTANPANAMGQFRAHSKLSPYFRGSRLRSAKNPAARTITPDQWWLYSDHASSFASLGALAPLNWVSFTATLKGV